VTEPAASIKRQVFAAFQVSGTVEMRKFVLAMDSKATRVIANDSIMPS
jgi:hypothetical protein